MKTESRNVGLTFGLPFHCVSTTRGPRVSSYRSCPFGPLWVRVLLKRSVVVQRRKSTDDHRHFIKTWSDFKDQVKTFTYSKRTVNHETLKDPYSNTDPVKHKYDGSLVTCKI